MLRYKEIFLGGRCNNNCLYCPPGRKTSAQTDLVHVSASLTREEEDGIALYGGEPTLRNDLPDIIRAAAGKGFRRVKLLTNGRAFSDPQILQRTLNAGCRLFEIELWGSNPSLHDYMTRTPGSFWETMNGLENLAGYPGDKFVCIRVPVCKETAPDTENIVVTALNFGVNRIVLSIQGYHAPFPSLLPHIRNAVNISIFNRTWILVEGLPFCAGQGLEAHMGEVYSGWDNIYDRKFRQHKSCVGCVCRELCPGVEAGYLERFGDKEFTPVLANRYFKDIKALHEY